MAKLIYSAITSLDGYVNDEEGGFGWAEPDQEVHSYVNELERPIGTYLYGRRIYEVMRYWQDPDDLATQPSHIKDYAEIWQAADKVVYSGSLDSASTPRTRLEREFDPAAVRHQFLDPVVVGGGTAWLPSGLHLELELLDEHRLASGVVHLHYRTRT